MQSLDDAQTLPLGVSPSFEVPEAAVTLECGDQLVLYTDGIIEATNSVREQFGTERLDAELSGCSSEPFEVIASLMKSLESFTDGALPSDDRTIVVAKFG